MLTPHVIGTPDTIEAGLRESIAELESDAAAGLPAPIEQLRRQMLTDARGQLARLLTAKNQYTLPGMTPPANTQLKFNEEN